MFSNHKTALITNSNAGYPAELAQTATGLNNGGLAARIRNVVSYSQELVERLESLLEVLTGEGQAKAIGQPIAPASASPVNAIGSAYSNVAIAHDLLTKIQSVVGS